MKDEEFKIDYIKKWLTTRRWNINISIRDRLENELPLMIQQTIKNTTLFYLYIYFDKFSVIFGYFINNFLENIYFLINVKTSIYEKYRLFI